MGVEGAAGRGGELRLVEQRVQLARARRRTGRRRRRTPPGPRPILTSAPTCGADRRRVPRRRPRARRGPRGRRGSPPPGPGPPTGPARPATRDASGSSRGSARAGRRRGGPGSSSISPLRCWRGAGRGVVVVHRGGLPSHRGRGERQPGHRPWPVGVPLPRGVARRRRCGAGGGRRPRAGAGARSTGVVRPLPRPPPTHPTGTGRTTRSGRAPGHRPLAPGPAPQARRTPPGERRPAGGARATTPSWPRPARFGTEWRESLHLLSAHRPNSSPGNTPSAPGGLGPGPAPGGTWPARPRAPHPSVNPAAQRSGPRVSQMGGFRSASGIHVALHSPVWLNEPR